MQACLKHVNVSIPVFVHFRACVLQGQNQYYLVSHANLCKLMSTCCLSTQITPLMIYRLLSGPTWMCLEVFPVCLHFVNSEHHPGLTSSHIEYTFP